MKFNIYLDKTFDDFIKMLMLDISSIKIFNSYEEEQRFKLSKHTLFGLKKLVIFEE